MNKDLKAENVTLRPHEELVNEIKKSFEIYLNSMSLDNAIELHECILRLAYSYYIDEYGEFYIVSDFVYDFGEMRYLIEHLHHKLDCDTDAIVDLIKYSMLNVMFNTEYGEHLSISPENKLDKDTFIGYIHQIIEHTETERYQKGNQCVKDYVYLLKCVKGALDALGGNHTYIGSLSAPNRTEIDIESCQPELREKVDVVFSFKDLYRYVYLNPEAHVDYNQAGLLEIKKDVDFLLGVNNSLIELKLIIICGIVNTLTNQLI